MLDHKQYGLSINDLRQASIHLASKAKIHTLAIKRQPMRLRSTKADDINLPQ